MSSRLAGFLAILALAGAPVLAMADDGAAEDAADEDAADDAGGDDVMAAGLDGADDAPDATPSDGPSDATVATGGDAAVEDDANGETPSVDAGTDAGTDGGRAKGPSFTCVCSTQGDDFPAATALSSAAVVAAVCLRRRRKGAEGAR